MKKLLVLLLVLVLTLPSLALAETTFDGTIVAGESVGVTAPFGGTVETVDLRQGALVHEGDVIAQVETTRVLATEDGTIRAMSGDTGIFIYPGYKFKAVDALITNFHLPESTLLMLVSALYNKEKIMEAYDVAVKERYRFFSFGDAMFIE